MTPFQYVWLIMQYARAVLYDFMWRYYVWLLLSLPARMFSTAPVSISSSGHHSGREGSEWSDGETSVEECSKQIWFVSVYLIRDLGDGRLTREFISGSQLMLLADDKGRIPFNMIQLYYPDASVLYARYLDMTALSSAESSSENQSTSVTTKIIDTKKRLDIHSGRKCRFGRIQF
jgi:hypothetical protein